MLVCIFGTISSPVPGAGRSCLRIRQGIRSNYLKPALRPNAVLLGFASLICGLFCLGLRWSFEALTAVLFVSLLPSGIWLVCSPTHASAFKLKHDATRSGSGASGR